MSATVQRIEPPPHAPAASTAAPARPMKTVSGYRLPGEGSSSRISTITVVLLLALTALSGRSRGRRRPSDTASPPAA